MPIQLNHLQETYQAIAREKDGLCKLSNPNVQGGEHRQVEQLMRFHPIMPKKWRI